MSDCGEKPFIRSQTYYVNPLQKQKMRSLAAFRSDRISLGKPTYVEAPQGSLSAEQNLLTKMGVCLCNCEQQNNCPSSS